VKIFTTGDNHLGKNLKKRKALRELAIQNFKAIPDKIMGEGNIDYVVFAGDVFDKENTDIQCNYSYAEVLSQLVSINTIKKIFIITGNHDQYNDYFKGASVDLVKVLKSNKIVCCNKDQLIYHNEEDKVVFFLLPYSRDIFLTNEVGNKIILDKINEFISSTFDRPEFNDCYKIMVSHFAIKEWMPFSTEAIEKSELKNGNHFNLVIMGDLHNETFEDIDLSGTSILYTGSTMQTSISDLHNHNNVAKVITIENNSLSNVKHIEFEKPKTIIVSSDDIESKRSQIDESTIVITNDLGIHMLLKDRVLYSMYKPIATKYLSDESIEEEEVDLEKLDINQIAKDKIDGDETIDEDTKNYLKTLVNIDVESMETSDLLEKVQSITVEGVIF